MTKRAKNPLIPSYRPRHDGWTHARTKTFIATLRQTGCVIDGCRVIGMSDTSAYRLRKKDATFREAWDAALTDARRGLIAVAHERAVVGKETIIYRNGEEVERRITPDSSILALMIKQGDLNGKIGNRTADKVITQEEWDAGVRFSVGGQKYEEEGDIKERLAAKLLQLRDRVQARKAEEAKTLFECGERKVNITTGAGFTAEVLEAAQRFKDGSVPRLPDISH